MSCPKGARKRRAIPLHRHISDAHSLAILGVLLRRGTLAIPLSPAEWSKSNDVILVDAVMTSSLSWLLISLVPPLSRLKRHQGLFSSLCAPRLGQPSFQPPLILTSVFFPLIFPDVYRARCGIEKKNSAGKWERPGGFLAAMSPLNHTERAEPLLLLSQIISLRRLHSSQCPHRFKLPANQQYFQFTERTLSPRTPRSPLSPSEPSGP